MYIPLTKPELAKLGFWVFGVFGGFLRMQNFAILGFLGFWYVNNV